MDWKVKLNAKKKHTAIIDALSLGLFLTRTPVSCPIFVLCKCADWRRRMKALFYSVIEASWPRLSNRYSRLHKFGSVGSAEWTGADEWNTAHAPVHMRYANGWPAYKSSMNKFAYSFVMSVLAALNPINAKRIARFFRLAASASLLITRKTKMRWPPARVKCMYEAA